MIAGSVADEMLEFVVTLCEEFRDARNEEAGGPYSFRKVLEFAGNVHRVGRRHGRLMEKECCEPLTSRDRKMIAECRRAFRDLCDRTPPVNGKKVQPIISGDPRGATFKIQLPSGKSDSWGGEGLCVPGS